MASSGSYNLTSSYGTIRIEWWVVSQNVAGNSTRVGWRAVATWASNTWYQVYACRVWINGAQVLNRGSAQTWGGQFANGEIDIAHNVDGTKAFGSNGEAAIYTSSINASGSGAWDLPTIPRWATFTGFSIDQGGIPATDESALWVEFSNPAGVSVAAFVEIIVGGSVVATPFNNTGVSSRHNFAVNSTSAAVIQAAMANTSTATIRIGIYSTVSGITQYDYRDRTITIANGSGQANPVFTDFSYKDSNAATVAITGNDQYIIQGQSALQVKVSSAQKMVAQKAATATNYRYQIGSIDTTQAYSTSDVVKELGTVGVNANTALVVTAVDSRALTKAVSKTVNILPYIAPQISPVLTRVNNFETSTKVSVDGVISRLTISGTDKNTVNTTSGLQYRYKKTTDATWGSWLNIASTTSSGNVSMTDFYVNLDRNFAWNVEFKLTDKITNTVVALVVSVGIPIFRIGKDGFVYNKEQPLMPSHVGQVIHSTALTTAAAVAAIYGGTWAAFGVGRVVVGVDTSQTEFNTVKKTGGAKTHNHGLSSGAAQIGSPSGNANALGFRNSQIGDLTGSVYSVGNSASATASGHPNRSHNTALTGSTDTVTDLMPYITLYMWERTA